MCGIIGILGAAADDAEAVREHVAALSHRGPDAQIVCEGEGFSFGHSLLAIIGLSPVQQPITSTDGAVTLTYNGEIYNYVELLADDPGLAKRCSGRSDTEVLVEGLGLYGIDFVERVNGIFAFAAVDRRSRSGYLVRDRLGVKPLYYTVHGERVCFSSELRSLLELARTPAAPDPEGYYSFARFRYPLGVRTFVKSVRMLGPGCILQVHDGKLSTRSYWQIQVPVPFKGTYGDACSRVHELLTDSIRIQMRSDHSFCTYLSGGLDSSYLSAVARQTKDELDTYSIGLSEASYDESRFAQLVADDLRTRHHPYHLDRREYRREHERFVDHLRGPLSVPNQVALKVLSRELARDHRCVLSGEGADEIFGGYGRIFLLPYDWQRLEQVRHGGGSSTASAFLSKFVDRYGTTAFPDYPSLFLRRYGYLTHEQAVAVLEKYFEKSTLEAARRAVEDEIRATFAQWQTDIFTRQLLLFQKMHLPGLLLRLDTATMAHSVEGRVPFLDHRLVEFLNGLPIEYRMRRKPTFPGAVEDGLLSDELSEVHDVPKSILKDIAKDSLHEDIVWRRKVGFPIPTTYFASRSHPATDDAPYLQWLRRNLELLDGGELRI